MTHIIELLFDNPRTADRAVASKLRTVNAIAAPVTVTVAPDLLSQVGREIVTVLDVPLGDLVLWAWEQHQLIREACDRTRGKPGATQPIAVLHHTLASTHRPEIRLDVDGRHFHLADLVLTVLLELDGLIVSVREGHVDGWGAGDAIASATLDVARPGERSSIRIATGKLRRISLPDYPGPGGRAEVESARGRLRALTHDSTAGLAN